MMPIGGILKVVGLRAASGVLAAFGGIKIALIVMAAGSALLFGAVQLGGYVERRDTEARTADAKVEAVRDRARIESALDDLADDHEAQLALRRQRKKDIRDANSDNGRIVLRADDDWLRAKRDGR